MEFNRARPRRVAATRDDWRGAAESASGGTSVSPECQSRDTIAPVDSPETKLTKTVLFWSGRRAAAKHMTSDDWLTRNCVDVAPLHPPVSQVPLFPGYPLQPQLQRFSSALPVRLRCVCPPACDPLEPLTLDGSVVF